MYLKTHVSCEMEESKNAVQFLTTLLANSGAVDTDSEDMATSSPNVSQQDVASTLPSLDSAVPTRHVFSDEDWERIQSQFQSPMGSNGSSPSHVVIDMPQQFTSFQRGYHGQNGIAWNNVPKLATPQTVMLAPETSELLKTAISSDLQVKLSMQFSLIQQSLLHEVREEMKKLLNEIKDEVRTLKRRRKS